MEEINIEEQELSEDEQKPSLNKKKEKYVALYQARTIIARCGTMPERRLCAKQLKIMQKKGIKSV